jgi:hypothetical protein
MPFGCIHIGMHGVADYRETDERMDAEVLTSGVDGRRSRQTSIMSATARDSPWRVPETCLSRDDLGWI